MTDSATDRGMVDATETDLALRRLEVVIPELENRWGALHPPGVEGNAEPSSEATDDVRKSCDEFQEIVNCLVEAQQHRPERPPFATDYDALYSRLRAIGRVEAKWKRLKEATDNLVLLHGRHLLQNGFYPNDLEYILTRQLAHCYQPLNPPLQGYRRYLRNLIDTMDRAKARPVSILDLPHELLEQIFGHVRHPAGRPWYGNSDYFTAPKGIQFFEAIKGIQNSRLTCRRFCALASPLLLDHIYVDIQSDSLARLVEVSQHPTLAKSIRGAHVNIRAYQSELFESLHKFATVQHDSLSRDIQTVALSGADEWYRGYSDDEFRKRIRALRRVATAWMCTSWEDPQRISGLLLKPHIKAQAEGLRASHETYRERYKDQQSVLENRHFVRTVVTALGRMPSLHFLAFGEAFRRFDWENYLRRKRLMGITVADPDAFAKLYGGNHHTFYFFGGNPQRHPSVSTDIVLPILEALPGAGVNLEHLAIWGCEPKLRPDPPNPQQREILGILAKKLVTVSIGARGIKNRAYVPMAHDFGWFLSSMMNTDSLKGIKVGTDYTGLEAGPISSGIGSFSNRGGTRFLCLRKVSIQGKELTQLITVLRSGGEKIYVNLSGVALLSGSWAVILDLLRGNVTSESYIGDLSGAEITNNQPSPFPWLFDRSLGDRPNQIETYILSMDAEQRNPIRELTRGS